MIFFLILQIASKCLLFSVNARIYGSDEPLSLSKAFYTILPMCPVVSLTMAILLNLYNWLFYYFKIG